MVSQRSVSGKVLMIERVMTGSLNMMDKNGRDQGTRFVVEKRMARNV